MNKMKFDIPIYLDPISLLDNAASESVSINIVDEIIAQINQGDPVWEDLIEEIAEEIVGEEESEENEDKKQEIIDQLSELNNDELKKYVSYTGQAEIDYEEQYEAGRNVSVFRVHGEFDTDKFAKDFDFGKEDDKEQSNSYEYWVKEIMDARLEYLDSDEKYEMYLDWKNNKEEPEDDEYDIEKEEKDL